MVAGRTGQEVFFPPGMTSRLAKDVEHLLRGTGIEPVDLYAMVDGSHAEMYTV